MDGDKDFFSLIDAAREGNYEEVTRLMKREHIDKRDDKGWTVLHHASIKGTGDIVRYLLSEGCNIEDESSRWKLRPIHIASMNGNKDALISLIEGQCCLDCVTERSVTPLGLVIQRGKTECQRILEDAMALKILNELPDLKLFESNILSKIMDPKTGKTVLDKLFVNKDANIMEAIKSKPVSEEEISEWMSLKLQGINEHSYRLLHECLLYRCIRHEYLRGFEKLCTPDIVNGAKHFMDLSILETVAVSGLTTFVERVLTRLNEVDESWTRAEKIATEKGFTEVAWMISERMTYLYLRKRKGFTRLHEAVNDNVPDMIEFLLEKGVVNADDGDKTIGTALSYSYERCRMRCARLLQNHKVNSDTIDWLHRSPLHVAISNRVQGDQIQYLVTNVRDIDAPDHKGLTVLDRTIINDCRIICDQLLLRPIISLDKCINIDCDTYDCDSALRKKVHYPVTSRETIYTLCLKFNRTIYPCLMERLDHSMIDRTDGDSNTLLHISAVLLEPHLCSQLIAKCGNVNFENKNDNTPLLELLSHNKCRNFNEIETRMIDTVDILINAGATLNMRTEAGSRIFELATEYNNEKLLLAMIQNVKRIKMITNELWHNWVDKQYLVLIRDVIPRTDKAFLQQYITVDDFMNILQDGESSLIKSLFQESSKFVQESVVEKILYKAARINDVPLFKYMIDATENASGYLDDGESLLTILIRDRKKSFIDLVLNASNVLIYTEKRNIRNKLPLHVCIECEYWEIIYGIIPDTVTVNAEDDDGNTPLSLLFTKMSEIEDAFIIDQLMGIVKVLIIKGENVYSHNKQNRAAIDYCTKPELKVIIVTYARRQGQRLVVTLPLAEAEAGILTSTSDNTSVVPQVGARAAPNLCSICDDEKIDCVLNCGHVFCMTCADKEVYCYNCRETITERKHIYL